MQINVDKTKTLIFRRKETKGTEQVKLNGEVIEDVDNFVYLGATITWNNDSSKDIERRIQLATGAYGDLKTIFSLNSSPIRSKRISN